MFSSAELKFNSVEYKFSTAELIFNTIEHNFHPNKKTLSISRRTFFY